MKDEEEAEIHLANLLLMIEIGMVASFEEARERRDEQEEAMREWWQRRKPEALTHETILRLLAEEETHPE